MIEHVKIGNFRGIRSAEVDLRALTVLVGPNDSGKSSFLDALEFQSFHEERHGLGASRPFERSDWQDGVHHPTVELSGAARRNLQAFRLPSNGVATECEGRDGDHFLGARGEFLAAFIDQLLRTDRPRFDAIEAAFKQRVLGVARLVVLTPSASSRSIHLDLEGGYRLAGEHLSVGSKMLLFFIALAHHPALPTTITVEEPENGVHPKRLADIMTLLRDLTQGRLSGRQTQVIVSTHSPYLVDQARLPEDQVLVFRRAPNGDRQVSPADPERLKTFLDEFMLGEIWFNQGEEGLVAKTA